MINQLTCRPASVEEINTLSKLYNTLILKNDDLSAWKTIVANVLKLHDCAYKQYYFSPTITPPTSLGCYSANLATQLAWIKYALSRYDFHKATASIFAVIFHMGTLKNSEF